MKSEPWHQHDVCMFSPSIMQRPLKTIAKRSGDVYIPRGVSVPALDKDILWEFQPKKIGIFVAFEMTFWTLK